MGFSLSRLKPKRTAKQPSLTNKEATFTRRGNKSLQGKKKGAKLDNEDLAKLNRARGKVVRKAQKRAGSRRR